MPHAIESGLVDESVVRHLVAVGLVARDMTPTAIARYSREHLSTARRSLEIAREKGIIQHDGTVEEGLAADLIGSLSPSQVSEIHATVTRRLLTAGRLRVMEAVDHARAAGPAIPNEELLGLALHTGRVCLSLNDWSSAEALLRLVVEISSASDQVVDSAYLRMFGQVLSALGRFAEAREVFFEAIEQAILKADGREAVEVLTQLVVPIEWNYSDRAAISALSRVSEMELDVESRVILNSLRSMVESWIPSKVREDQQFAWVSRASFSQPLSERSMLESMDSRPEARLIALAAWRVTHRAPQFLARRRRVSAEALDIAQTHRSSYFQIEAAVAMGVDALESGDRARYDEALTVARWVAEQHETRWLTWRAHTLLAGAAHLDGEVDEARRHREAAWGIASSYGISGGDATNTLLLVEEVLDRDDEDEMAAFYVAEDEPAVAHPIGRLALAYREARVGRHEPAERLLRQAIRQFDPESSYLFTGCRATSVLVAMVGSDTTHVVLPDVVEVLIEMLEPWVRHVAVDTYGLWCGGPVSLSLAELYRLKGDTGRAQVLLSSAIELARGMNDVRSLARSERLACRLGGTLDGLNLDSYGLNDRELSVLQGIVSGKTNQSIANELSYSLATIRNTTGELFRKLGVSNRTDAAAKAVAAGFGVNG